MKKVLIINEGYSSNFGDQAIKENMFALFNDLGYTVDFMYFSNPYVETLPAYKYLTSSEDITTMSYFTMLRIYLSFFYWNFKNKRFVKGKIKKGNYHAVIFGGGQLIGSTGKNYPSRFSISLFWITRYIKAYSSSKIYLLGVGVDSKFNFLERFFFRSALRKVDLAWVRDSLSSEILRKKFNLESRIIPDVAFFEAAEKDYQKKAIVLVGITNYADVYVKYNKESISKIQYFTLWASLLMQKVESGKLVKLFYTTVSDAQESLVFKEFLFTKYNLEIEIVVTDNLKDLNIQLQNAETVISGRMHALILGLKFGCKVEPYLISEKVKSFNDEYIDSVATTEDLSKKIQKEFRGFNF